MFFGKRDKLLRTLLFAVAFLIHSTAIVLAYYVLGLVMGAMLAPSVAKPLAIGVAALPAILGAVLWYQIIVQGRFPIRPRRVPSAPRPSGR